MAGAVALLAELLAHHVVIRVAGGDGPAHDLLRVAVRNGHRGVVVLHVHRHPALEVPEGGAARLPGDLLGKAEQLLQVHSHQLASTAPPVPW